MEYLLKSFTKTVKHWYFPLILGVLFIICGLYVFVSPAETYLTLALLFALSFLVWGLSDVFFSIDNRKSLRSWGWYFVGGLVSLLMGFYLLIHPVVSMEVLPFVVGFMLLFRSFELLGFAFEVKEAGVLNWGNLAIASVLGIIVSFVLLAWPVFTGVWLVVLTGSAFIFTGIASIILSLNLKRLKAWGDKLSGDLKDRIKKLNSEIKEALGK
ncbi:DUF308 domain-containing protein [Hoylesella oralis]|uniref:HdeD family acid-resistance protein n=1 Tax=Hoylesella oralis TaxID=28134 RepID=UPI0028E28137|nr:DUF308 domain-containing protein [Hoylesella oralis]